MYEAARAQVAKSTSRKLVGAAVNRSSILSSEGLSERIFTFAFSGLVYPQIWEDPVVDMEALALTSECRIVAIASGGCNVLSYLAAGPAHITAVDLNAAHIALNRLKLAAARTLPDHQSFFRMFGDADSKANIDAFDTYLAPHLDADTLAYWRTRDWMGRRRISQFSSNFYRGGLLGRFIWSAHLLVRLHGRDARAIMSAHTLDEQREIFAHDIEPLFSSPVVRWMIGRPASLFGLGIPPAQYKALSAGRPDAIGEALKERIRRLACDFPLSENYFARQAFGFGYGGRGGGTVPPYLDEGNFDTVKRNASRVSVRHVSLTDHLAGSPDASIDRYVLLDAQDWMGDADLGCLWTQITRTARPGARVIFRTAAEPSLLPGRIAEAILSRWDYRAEESARLSLKDRSAIYGGFHLYVLAR